MPVIIFISLFHWLSISCWRHLSRFTSMSFQISVTRADFFKCKDVSFHRERQTNVGKSHLQKAKSERVRGPIVSHDSPSAKPSPRGLRDGTVSPSRGPRRCPRALPCRFFRHNFVRFYPMQPNAMAKRPASNLTPKRGDSCRPPGDLSEVLRPLCKKTAVS